MEANAKAQLGTSSVGLPVPRRTAVIRRWMAWSMAAVCVASLAAWYFTRDTLPRTIRIATSPEGGLYHRVGDLLKPVLEKRIGRPVELVVTKGSVQNREKLLDERDGVHLAILQEGAVPLKGLTVVAPLYHDVVHVVVRKGSEIVRVNDLRGKAVVIGPTGSGMRESALVLLRHYGISADDIKQSDRYFRELLTDETLDAAIVTTGFLNHDLRELMESRKFDLLPITDAEALTIHHPYLSPRTIPAGVFEGNPPVPESAIPTVSTTAFLGARENVSEKLVRRALGALYEADIRDSIPTIIPLTEARRTTLGNLHPATRNYYDPFGGIDVLSNLLESLSAVKELLFAFAAGLYLVWDRWRRAKEREEKASLAVLKERLDLFLEQTVKLEQAQMETDDPQKLREYLDEVTRVKLRAIQELTHEDLRGDRMFSIFLLQCGDLAVKIQSKLNHRH